VGRRETVRALAWSAGLAVLYTVVAKFGLALGAVSGFATLVWPPTGIALAATLLLGYRVSPGIAAGAFLVNVWSGAPLLVAVGIAIGNTAEALLGAFVLGQAAFRGSLARPRDVLALIALAAVASTVVSASVGVASLSLGGIVSSGRAGETWEAWWMGDMMGDLIMAPVALTFLSPRHAWRDSARLRLARLAEALVLAVLLVGMSAHLFAWRPNDAFASLRQPYMIFPLLIWAALSFGIRGASAAVFVVSAIAIAGTAVQAGPFASPHLAASLLDLQTFMAIVAATTLILGSVSEERSQALAMRESLVSLAAHELRTPLTSLLLRIQGLARSLRPGAASSTDPARDADVIEGLVKRMGRLVDDLLDVSRLSGIVLRLDFEDVDLSGLTREVVERLPESQQALISVAGTGETLVGQWDRLRMDQIVSNLISNALKYGANNPVEVVIERVEERARLVVRDHGVGIAEQDLKRIFERFERAAATNISGFGVGLWIVRHVVRSMGGTVEVTSRVGVGSTFVVEMPLRAQR
jgi:signal transduction histidine kinase